MTKPRRPGWIVLIAMALALVGSAATARADDNHASVSARLSVSDLQPGQQAAIAVIVDVDLGFHIQSHNPVIFPGADLSDTQFIVNADKNPAFDAFAPQYPPGQDLNLPELGGKQNVYETQVVVFIPIVVKKDAALGPISITGSAAFQACDDKNCFQKVSVPFSIKTRIVPLTQATVPSADPVFKGFDPKVFTQLKPVEGPAAPVKAQFDFFGLRFSLGSRQYLLVFALAFGVGIIFNLMPCVLPVVPLKIYGFYEVSRHNRAKSFALGGVFSLGLIGSFGVLALLVVVLHSLQWGELFSYTWFTVVIVVILVTMALSMFGLFTVLLPTDVYRLAPNHETYWGNFLFGILTAVLSTPCTAPMFVGLLAWAAIVPASVGVASVMMVGVGMAFPYLVLSATPEIARRMPRSGPWAEILKQMMGFLLLAVAVYFAGGKLNIHGRDFIWLVAAVLCAGGAFLIIRTLQIARTHIGDVVGCIIGTLMIAGSIYGAWRLTYSIIDWRPYSAKTFADARATGKPVMVEFTAAWCSNCLALEATVFRDPGTARLLKEHGAITIRADLTSKDAPGWALLHQLSSTGGIPLTAIYGSGRDTPLELTSVYRQSDLAQTLNEVSPLSKAPPTPGTTPASMIPSNGRP